MQKHECIFNAEADQEDLEMYGAVIAVTVVREPGNRGEPKVPVSIPGLCVPERTWKTS
jgi:hypothetical protein